MVAPGVTDAPADAATPQYQASAWANLGDERVWAIGSWSLEIAVVQPVHAGPYYPNGEARSYIPRWSSHSFDSSLLLVKIALDTFNHDAARDHWTLGIPTLRRDAHHYYQCLSHMSSR